MIDVRSIAPRGRKCSAVGCPHLTAYFFTPILQGRVAFGNALCRHPQPADYLATELATFGLSGLTSNF